MSTFLLLSLLAGCPGPPAPAPTAPTSNPAEAPTATSPASAATGTATSGTPAVADDGPDTWTTTTQTEKRTGATNRLVDVRTGRHDGYDRVVFELAAAPAPGWEVGYVDGPVRDCGSGAPVELRGAAALRVQLSPANAHDDAGAPVGPKESLPGLPAILELERTCDFEAVSSYVAGLAARTPFRAFELTSPPRLVVDVRH